MKPTRLVILIAALVLPSLAFAQTSGTLATQTNTTWATAPWVPGPYPDGGGTAEFDTFINNIIGTVPGLTVITMDVTPTISEITFNSPFSYQLAAGAGGINLDAGGGTFNMTLTSMSTPTLTQLADPITAAISGGGSNGLTINGPGTLTLAGANTYTGGTTVNGATLAIAITATAGTGSALADGTLGAAANGLTLNGGTLAVSVATSGGTAITYTTGRNITLGSNGGTFLLFTPMVVNGVVSGPGSLTVNNSTLTLGAANTYQGATILNSSFSGLTLTGNGSINQSSSIDLAGTLTLSNTTTNNADRLNDTGTITDRGATITMTGNASAATNEVAGSLVLANGVSTILVTPNAAQQASLNFSSITRQNNSTLFVRGTSLGATAGNGIAEITSTASPGTLIGGGGIAGSQNISILPWAVGNVSGSATTNSSFVTYDSGTGQFRPLATAEYSTLASGESDTNNTKVSAATAISAATTVNSVLVTGTGTLLSGTGGLNITSGALMYSPTNTTAGTISANVNFGSAEGVISSTAGAVNSTSAGLTMSGVISGTGGLTLNPVIGSDIALTNANNSYTGTTTLLGGLTIVSGTIASGSNSIFGADTSALVLNFSNNTNLNGFYASATTTLNRGLNVIGSSTSSAFLLTTAGIAFTLNGNISLANNTRLDMYNTAGGTAANAFILNGVISGAGSLSDNATTTTFTQLNGANTYTGGTNIQTGTYEVGADSTGSSGAFGTGTIYFSGAGGGIQSVNATAHTISNDIFIGSALSATAASNPTFKGTGALNFTGNVNLNGSRGLNFTNTGGTTFSGTVSNGAMTKFGTGALALTSATGNTYTGGTVLGTSAGTLNVNNASGSGTGSGTVSIGGTTAANRSTLSGNFTISGAAQDSGVLSPGNGATLNGVGDAGTANFGSSLTLTSNTVVTLELASPLSFDKVNVGGLLTLAGAVNVTTISGYVAQLGDSFTLLTWGTLNSTGFSIANLNTTGATTAAGTTWDTSTFLTDGTIRVVPEPSTIMFVVSGLGILGASMRRRRS